MQIHCSMAASMSALIEIQISLLNVFPILRVLY